MTPPANKILAAITDTVPEAHHGDWDRVKGMLVDEFTNDGSDAIRITSSLAAVLFSFLPSIIVAL